MTREEAIKVLNMVEAHGLADEAKQMAIQALSQEPCELLIIKSDILLHQDDRKKWVESIKREKESGVIILPPYFEPLLVPNDIEINIEQEPCDDAVSREELLKAISTWDKFGVDDTNSLFRLDNLSLPHYVPYIHYDDVIKCIKGMPSVTQKSKTGHWKRISMDKYTTHAQYWYECDKCGEHNLGNTDYCPSCGCRMESEEV